MTAEEIRREKLGANQDQFQTAIFLREIAAQLAEHNERMQRFEEDWKAAKLGEKLTAALDKAAKGIFW